MPYYVYIMGSQSGVLYTGVTNDLPRRVQEHKQQSVPSFTAKYNVTKLLYYEAADTAYPAITREKQIKGWLRKKKVELINSMNPDWKDLSSQLFDS